MNEERTGPAVVESVINGSPAHRTGIRSGDRIKAIDGLPMRDAIDFSILMENDVVHELEIERPEKNVKLLLEIYGEEHGINLESPVFGPLMLCNNDCLFCFVDQLPAGLRKTLYVKDDDYRLSFLQGNFITLTNLSSGDTERIIEDRLSPLYVSLHTFSPGLRASIFNNPDAGRALDILKNLLDGNIEIHIQIVLMKGLNDGLSLEETLKWLSGLGPGIASIGIVPVGATTVGRKRVPGEYLFNGDSSSVLIEQVEGWRNDGYSSGIYLADEFYYLSGLPPPEAAYYDDYPQAENGIGLARLFVDRFNLEISMSSPILNPEGKAIITSPMGSWVLDQISVDGSFIQREVCRNSLLGERVTVCGLMAGRDVRACLDRTYGAETVLIPGIALSNGMFIDGVTLKDISMDSGRNLLPVYGNGFDLVQALSAVEWSDD